MGIPSAGFPAGSNLWSCYESTFICNSNIDSQKKRYGIIGRYCKSQPAGMKVSPAVIYQEMQTGSWKFATVLLLAVKLLGKGRKKQEKARSALPTVFLFGNFYQGYCFSSRTVLFRYREKQLAVQVGNPGWFQRSESLPHTKKYKKRFPLRKFLFEKYNFYLDSY